MDILFEITVCIWTTGQHLETCAERGFHVYACSYAMVYSTFGSRHGCRHFVSVTIASSEDRESTVRLITGAMTASTVPF